MSERIYARLKSAAIAVDAAASAGGVTRASLREYSDAIYSWVVAPETVSLRAVLTVKDKDGKVVQSFTSTRQEGDSPMADSASLTVDQFAGITISTADDHGNPTADSITWTFDDAGTILTPTVSTDTKTVALAPAGPEGVVNVTGADPSSPSVASYQAQLTVGAGATSTLTGAVTVQDTPVTVT